MPVYAAINSTTTLSLQVKWRMITIGKAYDSPFNDSDNDVGWKCSGGIKKGKTMNATIE